VVISESNAKEFASKLVDIEKADNKTLVAYKGASIVILSRFKKLISEKSKNFKEGAKMVEFAVASEPNNIEIRLIRLSIQEKAPKIVNYNKNKKEDKEFLLDHYKEQSGNLKAHIKNFMLQSKSFSAAEKQTIN
jgi:septum formation inhibitor MinC